MSKAPQDHFFRLGPWQSGPVNSSPFAEINSDEAAAFSIGAASEVDACAIKDGTGSIHYVSVGCPVYGPFKGPFQILTFAGVFPPTDDGTPVFDSNGSLRHLPPLVHVVQHLCPPHTAPGARAPMQRRWKRTLATGYTNCAFEVPVWGRRLVTISMTTVGSAADVITGMKVAGAMYYTDVGDNGGDALSYGQANDGTHQSIDSDLVLDPSTGATELVTDFTTRSVTVEAECFHTLKLFVKSTAGTRVLRFLARGLD